ncbi:hypothetical protein GCM10010415_74920 [Streptomyces atrovirens]
MAGPKSGVDGAADAGVATRIVAAATTSPTIQAVSAVAGRHRLPGCGPVDGIESAWGLALVLNTALLRSSLPGGRAGRFATPWSVMCTVFPVEFVALVLC